MIFRPMLASTLEGEIKFPCSVSAKIDGVRAYIQDSVVMSRSGRPIRNEFIQSILGKKEYSHMDGELTIGDFRNPKLVLATVSGVNTYLGEPDFTFRPFDYLENPSAPFRDRYRSLKRVCESFENERIKLVEQFIIRDQLEFEKFEQSVLSEGYEGVMIRDFTAPYKNGRSTAKQGWLLKVKRFSDSEAEIIGFEALQSNLNCAKINSLGYMERSSSKEGLIEKEMLGAISVRDVKTGVKFSIGTGFDATMRHKLWSEKDSLIGRIVNYRHFEKGSKDKPRFPVFIRFRDEIDF